MPYDPDLPINGEIVDADELRAQLAALHEETLAVEARVEAIPAGPPGADGNDGAPGPPFASAVVDAVTTLDPGNAATVESSFDGTTVHLSFGLPRGADGMNGSDGGQGETGAPGEVSQAALEDAVAGTSRNADGIEAFGGGFSDPPTQAEMQDFASYVEQLRQALRR